MSLLDLDHFEPVFRPLEGSKVGFVAMDGNVGDGLIEMAARQLLEEFGVEFRPILHHELEQGELYEPVDRLLVSGGGNLGILYPKTAWQRNRALSLGPPVTVLPQSLTDDGEDLSRYDRVFVRERASLSRARSAELAPDLALGLRPPWLDEGAEAGTGIWLREDPESVTEDRTSSLGDPVSVSRTIHDYLGLASKFEHIVTDRLHFAIAGLLLNRRVTLLPNSYAKNRSMYETWLRDLGCRWRARPPSSSTDREQTVNVLWRRLSAPPSALVPWTARPRLRDGWRSVSDEHGESVQGPDDASLQMNPLGQVVVSLCNGEWTPEDICMALADQYRQPVIDVARPVQETLRELLGRGVIETDTAPEALARGERRMPAERAPIDVEIGRVAQRAGMLRWSARVRGTSRGDSLLYFETPARWRHALTRRGDPFLLALLPRAMREGRTLRITGAPVDRSLIDHLDEFQHAWWSWRPERLNPVRIIAEETDVRPSPKRPAIAAFSGGVDSTYTLFRHLVSPDGRRNRDLEAVVMACGFDIPVNDRHGFEGAARRLGPVAEAAGADFIEVFTNIRTYTRDWQMEHGPALAAALSLFAGRFGAGIVPSTAPYQLMFPWGSNPITDPLLGGAFEVRHDSASVLRHDKLKALSGWAAGRSGLRVCWRGRDAARNCGNCSKCCHLAMVLTVLGAPLDCFERPPSSERLLECARKASLHGLELIDLSCLLREANKREVDAPWIRVLAERKALVQPT